MVLADTFKRRDLGRLAKSGLDDCCHLPPLISVLVYMIAQPPGQRALR
jgi:hypothetical protein